MTTIDPKKHPLGIDADAELIRDLPGVQAKIDGLAAQRAAAMDALKPNCGNCHCGYFSIDDPESWGECRYEPPRMQIIAMPPKIAGQGPVYQPLAAWPPVQRTQWCVTGFMVKAGLEQ